MACWVHPTSMAGTSARERTPHPHRCANNVLKRTLTGCAATPEPADLEPAAAVSAGDGAEAEPGNVSVKRENEKVVCHHERDTGTHFSRRVCRTVSEA